jgi:hypothetical protein
MTCILVSPNVQSLRMFDVLIDSVQMHMAFSLAQTML